MLYLEDMDGFACGRANCAHHNENAKFVGNCHPDGPIEARYSYAAQALTLYCAAPKVDPETGQPAGTCGKPIEAFAIGYRPAVQALPARPNGIHHPAVAAPAPLPLPDPEPPRQTVVAVRKTTPRAPSARKAAKSSRKKVR